MDIEVIKGYQEDLIKLANVCDHASERDGVGFSKVTATSGHLLAHLPLDLWTEEHKDAAFGLIRHHGKQLGYTAKHFTGTPKLKIGTHTAVAKKGHIFLKDGHWQCFVANKSNPLFNALNFLSSFNGVNQVAFPQGYLYSFDSIINVCQMIGLLNLGHRLYTINDESLSLFISGDHFNPYNSDDFELHCHTSIGEFAKLVHKTVGLPVRVKEYALQDEFISQLARKELKVARTLNKAKTKAFVELSVTKSELDELNESIDVSKYKRWEMMDFGGFTKFFMEQSKHVEDLIAVICKNSGADLVNEYDCNKEEYSQVVIGRAKEIVASMELEGVNLKVSFSRDLANFHEILSEVRGFTRREFVSGEKPYWNVSLKPPMRKKDLETVERLRSELDVQVENSEALDEFIRKNTSIDIKDITFSKKGSNGIAVKTPQYIGEVYNFCKYTVSGKFSDDSVWVFKSSIKNLEALKEFVASTDCSYECDFDIDELIGYETSAVVRREQARKTLFVISNEKDIADNENPVSKDSFELGNTLKPFQFAPIHYSMFTKRFFIADDMGLGKTLEAIAVAQYHQCENIVIVSPNLASPTWAKEIRKFINLTDPSSLYRFITKKSVTKYDLEEIANSIDAAKYTIIHYDMLKKLMPAFTTCNKFDCFIADESHYLKDEKTARTKSVQELVAHHNPEVRMLLSGTITTGRPKDLVPQLDILGITEDVFGGGFEFKMRYCGATHNGYGWNFNGSSNLEELHEKLRSSCMVRRKKVDVLKDLPEKIRQSIEVPLSNIKEYEKAEKDIVKNLEAGWMAEALSEWEAYKKDIQNNKSIPAKKRKEKLSKAAKEEFIKPIVSELKTKFEDGGILSEMSALHKLASIGKVEGSTQFVQDYFSQNTGNPLIVFAHFKESQNEIIKACKELGMRVGTILASNSVDERSETEDRFQRGEFDVCVASLLSANVNLTLTAADTLYFHDTIDRVDALVQGEDRALRIGSEGRHDSINVYYAVSENTVEADIWVRNAHKFNSMEMTLNNEKGVLLDDVKFKSYGAALLERVKG